MFCVLIVNCHAKLGMGKRLLFSSSHYYYYRCIATRHFHLLFRFSINDGGFLTAFLFLCLNYVKSLPLILSVLFIVIFIMLTIFFLFGEILWKALFLLIYFFRLECCSLERKFVWKNSYEKDCAKRVKKILCCLDDVKELEEVVIERHIFE